MKLLFAHDRFGAQAGAESNLYHTAREMKRRGHTVGIMYEMNTNTGEEKWKQLFKYRFPITGAGMRVAAAKALSSFKPDLVYLHNTSDLSLLEALAKGEMPVIRMVHDHNLFCLRGCKYPHWSRRPCTRALGPYCVFPCGGVVRRHSEQRNRLEWVSYSKKVKELELNKQFDRVIVASKYMRDELIRNGFKSDRIEMHAPVPPALETTTVPSFSVRNRIVYAGQIVRGKGVDVLLKSLAQVKSPFVAIIVGDGHHRAYCETLASRLSLGGKVHFLGYLPQEELISIYQDASLAVVSSVWPEPFGATGLEAMRCGLPVVGFDAGGISEWLKDGENGFLVPWMDHTLYAERIDSLLRDKAEALRMGQNGRRIALEQFGFEKYIDDLEQLFSSVFKESQGKLVCA